MASPEFLGDGHTPRRSDALWAIEQKILGAIIDFGGVSGGGSALFGSGSPEGVVSAAQGSTYVRTDTSGFWYKVSGSGNTGWAEGIA